MVLTTKDEVLRVAKAAEMQSRLSETVVNIRFNFPNSHTAITYVIGVPMSYRDFSKIAAKILSTYTPLDASDLSDADVIRDNFATDHTAAQYIDAVNEAFKMVAAQAIGGFEEMRRLVSTFGQFVEHEVDYGVLTENLHRTKKFAQ